MKQLTHVLDERTQRSLGRAQTASALATPATPNAFGNVWNAMPCVPDTAICTHGKRYVRRLQETFT